VKFINFNTGKQIPHWISTKHVYKMPEARRQRLLQRLMQDTATTVPSTATDIMASPTMDIEVHRQSNNSEVSANYMSTIAPPSICNNTQQVRTVQNRSVSNTDCSSLLALGQSSRALRLERSSNQTDKAHRAITVVGTPQVRQLVHQSNDQLPQH